MVITYSQLPEPRRGVYYAHKAYIVIVCRGWGRPSTSHPRDLIQQGTALLQVTWPRYGLEAQSDPALPQ